MKKLLLCFLGISFCLNSCSEDEIQNESGTENQIKNEQALKELSFLVATTLSDKDVRTEVSQLVDQVDTYGDAVSFALLLNAEQNISKYEKRKINSGELSRKGQGLSLFKEKLNRTYNENKGTFKELPKIIGKTPALLSKGTEADFSEIENYLIENNLELYFPYKENFDWDDLISYTVTYEDNHPDENYEGFGYNGMTYSEVRDIVDDYLYNNPTVAIIRTDEDYIGSDTRLTINGVEHYIDPNQSMEKISKIYHDIYQSYYSGGGTGGDTPPQRVRLSQNVNPNTFFNPEHILTTYIPKVRITNRNWKRALSKSHRTKIARAGAIVGFNPNGTYSAVNGSFYFDFDISASDLRNKRWKTLNYMFDPNWHKVKGSQQIAVWTLRKNSSESSVNVKTEIKLDAQGNYTPTASVSVNNTLNSGGKAIFRGNAELDRYQVLTTIIGGSEYDNATYNENGLNLSIRRVSSFEYFFDHYYTNL
ncbi:hypothetical protein [Empedobacter brevis]|uniref:hypothetical protein n=1 Tax=Empedobacter brevis TaxID=247 RepID=UPI0023F58514|nr:hypothetical protein [Empedobacter brevis]